MQRHTALTLLAAVGAAAPALAQDSVGTSSGLPGDALNPWNTGTQSVSYVADLAPLETSWGTTFGIVPLVKTPKVSDQFFNNLLSANGISDDLLQGVPYFSSSYAVWEDAPGVGVNPDENLQPQFVEPTGASSQFAVGLSSFGTANGFSVDSITSAIVNYDPSDPNRLYVTRVETAVTVPATLDGQTGGVAFGSIDANGNAYYRGDDFGSGGGVAPQLGNNLYRTRVADRGSVVNFVDFSGGSDATDRLLFNSGTTHIAPSNIPASVAGGSGLVAGSNFNTEFVRGAASPLIANSNHLQPEVDEGYVPDDHRGSIGTTTRSLLGSGVATTAILSKDNSGVDNDTRTLSVWSTDAAGNVAEGYSFETPLMVVDPIDGETVNYTVGANGSQYRLYAGIQAFRGGGGLVGLGQDAQGNAYAAATMSEFGFSWDLAMQNLVVRFGPDGEDPEWSIMAWVDPTGTGKEILDGPGGAPIGNLVPFRTAFPNAGQFGPAMSTPTFDGAGNGWFIASAALDKIDPDTGEPFIDFDNVLVRAVRTELPGQTPSYGYELELVLELANIFGGVNSGLPYQIQFLDLSVSSGDDGRGTASPATIDHNNGRTWGWDNTDLDGIDPADPITNGGIVLSAEIVYDVDGDGDFEDPTGGGADPASADQAYQTLLYVGYYDDAQGCNAADIALPFGILDLQDVNTFVSAFTSQDPLADIDDNGIFDLVDINSFANAFLAGCP